MSLSLNGVFLGVQVTRVTSIPSRMLTFELCADNKLNSSSTL